MNQTDLLLLVVSLILASMSVATRGWGVHGLGPAILVLAGGVLVAMATAPKLAASLG